MFFSKEINRQKNVKPLLLRNNDVLKTFRKKKTFGKENLKKCTSFKEQKGTRDIQGQVFLALLPSAVFRLQNCVSDFFQFVLLGR